MHLRFTVETGKLEWDNAKLSRIVCSSQSRLMEKSMLAKSLRSTGLCGVNSRFDDLEVDGEKDARKAHGYCCVMSSNSSAATGQVGNGRQYARLASTLPSAT